MHLDRPGRRLIAMPIHYYLPELRSLGRISFLTCDAVMNFAVFRRSIFNDQIRWDERFKSNGEHEDFYLNLKLAGNLTVAYLPSMLAEHNRPALYPGYEMHLRERTEGWRLFMTKWEIDRYLDFGGGVRGTDDPGTTRNETVALAYRQSWYRTCLGNTKPVSHWSQGCPAAIFAVPIVLPL